MLTKVVGRATKRPGDVGYVFCKTKVSNADMALCIQQQIFRLQITVDHVLGMQILDRKHHLSRIEFCNVIRKPL